MKQLIITVFIFSVSISLSAQQSELPISIGYFAPYGINPGLKIGTSFQLNTKKEALQNLSISPQVGFWATGAYGENIHNTFVFDTYLDYRKYHSNQRFYGLASVGLSYQLGIEGTDVSVNLGGGQLTPQNEIVHYLVPMVNIGFGQDFNQLGYYLKGFVGQRFASTNGNHLFFGGELGFTYFLKRDE